jgi:hypothetical protein
VQVREWNEESGLPAPSDTSLYIELGTVQQTSKTVAAWCFKGDCDPSTMHSNTWTDHHGRTFPEIDEYRWVSVSELLHSEILVKAQEVFLERIAQAVAADVSGAAPATGVDGAVARSRAAPSNGASGGLGEIGSTRSSGSVSGLMALEGGRMFRGATMPDGWYAVGEDMAVWQSDPPPGPLPLRSCGDSSGHERVGNLVVAAFDFDDCVAVCGQAGKAWTGDAKDWRMKFAHVPQVLRHLHESGFLLAVMSNESTARLKNPDAIQKALDRKCGRIEAWACVALLHCICCVVLLEVHRRRLWWTKTHAVHTSDRCLR